MTLTAGVLTLLLCSFSFSIGWYVRSRTAEQTCNLMQYQIDAIKALAGRAKQQVLDDKNALGTLDNIVRFGDSVYLSND